MRWLLFIVSPRRPDLYEGFKNLLDAERGVEIIIDRRVGSRRLIEMSRPASGERRRSERRQRARVDKEIEDYGWSIVKATSERSDRLD